MIPGFHVPWLSLSVLTPLIGAIAISLMDNRDRAQKLAIWICAATFLCTCAEWIDLTLLDSFEAQDRWNIFGEFFKIDTFVVDELSAPLLPLGTLIYLATVLTTLRTKLNRFSFASTLFSEAVFLATLGCQAPWMIILLLAVGVIPPWLELRKRRQSTAVYSLHMGVSIGLLVIGQAISTFAPAVPNAHIISGCLMTGGLLIRCGVCPLHCWMSDLFEKATFGTALLFVTPMIGPYAIMRLVFPIAPDWALQSIAVLSLITAVYAAGMALVQHESRRFFCYLFLSNSSLVLVGLEMATPVALTGALFAWQSVAISLSGFGLALRSVESRTGRLSLEGYHGLYEHTPFLASMFLLTGLASIGFPGTIGFVGIELLVEGVVSVYPLTGLAVAVVTALNGIAVLKAFFHIFTGARHIATISLVCRPAERAIILIIVILIIGGGAYPQLGILARYHTAVTLLQTRASDAALPGAHTTEKLESHSQGHPDVHH
ncbi:proton-conducting transporter membrane subunit [Blastopirellula marina]|uniref:Oxidoreductase n=1 Tax=Blastopirellula marina TaxID=124 RepID=A0A2S8F9R3_9BACT|nr:proton-conducting transporter membrane subunit [Blastopirellula marina]PQO28897.1 oxidoreductase [Blastopirellula marina]PTL42170.1 oxidoreductase [Blastopirellula marina]